MPPPADASNPAHPNDWAYARTQYETTGKSATTIAAEVGVSVTALLARASRQGWTRDAARATANRAAELLMADRRLMEERRRTELEAIERVNVAMQAQALAHHRKDIAQARTIVQNLFGRLPEANTASEDVEVGSLEELTLKANIANKLSTSLKTLILLERQALGVNSALVDPADDNANAPTTPQDAALDLLINRFASVLQSHHDPAPMKMADVVDVEPAAAAAAAPKATANATTATT